MIDLTHTKVEEFIMTVQTPYRYDVVGSFLRSERLKHARENFNNNLISKNELKKIENEEISDFFIFNFHFYVYTPFGFSDMRNLLNFLLKYNHWFLFVLLEVISLTLLFRFNNYQGSAFFTSANYLAGIVYEASSQVTRYFGLTEVNKDLTARNVELEIEVERLSQALEQYTQDTTGVANLRKEALKDYVLYDARVVNNSITHPNNFITIDKGEADGIRPEMGVVCGNGVVGIVYLTGIMPLYCPY